MWWGWDPYCPPSGQMAGLYASMVAIAERGQGGIAGSSERQTEGAFADTGHSFWVKEPLSNTCAPTPLCPTSDILSESPCSAELQAPKQKTLLPLQSACRWITITTRSVIHIFICVFIFSLHCEGGEPHWLMRGSAGLGFSSPSYWGEKWQDDWSGCPLRR